MKFVLPLMILVPMLVMAPAHATRKDDASAKIITRLQGMVKDATAERDRLAKENAMITADLEKIKKEFEQEKSAKQDLESKLNLDLTAQKTVTEQTKKHLDDTTARLREVIEKYHALTKAKNELAAEHLKLKNEQQFTTTELKSCSHKNVKMFEGAKAVIAAYEGCKNKSVFEALVDAEPVTQIRNVEFEVIIQEFEDKIRKQKFQGKTENHRTN